MRRAWLWRRLSLWRIRREPWSCPAISARHDLQLLLLLGGVPLDLVILRPVLALVRVLRLPPAGVDDRGLRQHALPRRRNPRREAHHPGLVEPVARYHDYAPVHRARLHERLVRHHRDGILRCSARADIPVA